MAAFLRRIAPARLSGHPKRADAVQAAAEVGRIGVLAATGQRDLAKVAAKYPDLFPQRLFDHAMFGTIALTSAYCAPWLGKAQSRILNLASLLVFGLDWQVEQIAVARLDDMVRRCLAVADGADPEPGDGVTGLIALLRTELASISPAFSALHPIWTDVLRRTLAAMARERDWAAESGTGVLPSATEYLDNAASTGCSIAFVSLWMVETGKPETAKPETAKLEIAIGPDLSAALHATERVLRLVNDVGSYTRDVHSGDLNVLMLGVTRTQLDQDIDASTRNALSLLRPLRVSQPRWATYVERQIGFVRGIYGVGDFWGQP